MPEVIGYTLEPNAAAGARSSVGDWRNSWFSWLPDTCLRFLKDLLDRFEVQEIFGKAPSFGAGCFNDLLYRSGGGPK
jgi:hypothetical protein